jgi:hypothetical protein
MPENEGCSQARAQFCQILGACGCGVNLYLQASFLCGLELYVRSVKFHVA